MIRKPLNAFHMQEYEPLAPHIQACGRPRSKYLDVTACEAGKKQNCSDCTSVNKLHLMKRHQGPNHTKDSINLLLLVKLFNW